MEKENILDRVVRESRTLEMELSGEHQEAPAQTSLPTDLSEAEVEGGNLDNSRNAPSGHARAVDGKNEAPEDKNVSSNRHNSNVVVRDDDNTK